MTKFDASQRRVLELDAARHARVLGAPGSGKTLMLVEAFATISRRQTWSDESLLVLAPNRLVAAGLRRRLERRLDRAIGGTPVRTATSLAFALLQRRSALQGQTPSRLLTGTAQDEAVEAVLADVVEGRLSLGGELPFAPEALLGEAFRGELRELNRVLDDFGLEPGQLAALLRQQGAGGEPAPSAQSLEQWQPALELVRIMRERLRSERPGELTASAMMRVAGEVMLQDDLLAVPRLVLVDDAAEVGEGALALLASMAERGSKIWVFGDPDTATGAFQGERSRVLVGLGAEFSRRGVAPAAIGEEQLVVLETVHRHGPEIRGLVERFASRIGTAGAGQQRTAAAVSAAVSVECDDAEGAACGDAAVQFALATTAGEQLGVIAHRLRSRHLALGSAQTVPWSRMAVVCRSRAEVKRAARLLASHQVPSSIAAGGLVLREHQLVREFVRLLQHALGISPLSPREVGDLLVGDVGGLDPISLRRLRSALRLSEVRAAQTEGRPALSADELLHEAFRFPGDRPVLDMRAARRLMRFGRLAAEAAAVHLAAGTPREVLWQLWQGSGLASELQQQALDTRGSRSDEAHRALDAVVALFFALQRHEEQDSDRPISEVLDELLTSTVPEDTLAARSEREVVTVTTPQGLIGMEFDIVCVLGLQDGSWPNLRTRGSLLGVTALERLLREGRASAPSRRETLHDELRLLVHSLARARREVLVVALANEEQHPSPFFFLGRDHLVERLPSSRLTLRGAVAQMRRRIVRDPADREALDSLAALALAGVPGAHPDDWYGATPPSSSAPLADIDAGATVTVSPSELERAERCPLDWIVSRLAGSEGGYQAGVGTLLHHALETAAPLATAEQLLEAVREQWGSLRFEAKWQSQRALEDAEAMTGALADYLQRFEASESRLLATEGSFEVPIEFARLRGKADRIEASPLGEGGIEVTVVDLKTGRRVPPARDVEQHAQLQAYQLGVVRGAFKTENGEPIEAASTTARLLYVHPGTLSKTRQARGERYVEVEQGGLGQNEQTVFEQRVLDAAVVMAGSAFTAQVEHHCEAQHGAAAACALHIIPTVSHA